MQLTWLTVLLICYRDKLLTHFDVYVRKAIVKFSVEKIKMYGIFRAFLMNKLDIFRIINLLVWKKIPILHVYLVLSATWYNGISQGICKNADLWTVPNLCVLVPVESHQCLIVLVFFEITWWSLFTYLAEKIVRF